MKLVFNYSADLHPSHAHTQYREKNISILHSKVQKHDDQKWKITYVKNVRNQNFSKPVKLGREKQGKKVSVKAAFTRTVTFPCYDRSRDRSAIKPACGRGEKLERDAVSVVPPP